MINTPWNPIAAIHGIGIASPPYSVSQRNSLEFAQTLLMADQPVAVGDSHRRAADAGSAPPDRADASAPPEETPAGHRGLAALYRMSTVRRRGSVLLESDALSSVDGVLEQSFYPRASSPTDRGPSTAERNERFAQEALPLAKAAAIAALADADLAASEITHLIVVTCTGFYSPGIDVQLIDQLELSDETERVQVGFMGCHGAINGLRVALGLVAADPQASVLLVCVELCTLHYQYGWETDHVVSNAIFADGAAAMVIRTSGPGAVRNRPRILATGSKLIANSEDAMSWRIGDHGFEMTLSAEVPGIIESQLKPFLSRWLSQFGLNLADVAGWAVHPGGPRILRSVQNALRLADDQLVDSRAVLAEHGNMSSPTMVFIVDRFRRSAVELPWLMLGFGPGLEVEVALLC